MNQKEKVVILSSGGLDSTTVMAIAKSKNYEIYSLSFQYGQRHCCELKAAKKVAKVFGAKQHLVVKTNFSVFGGSALTAEIDVPKSRDFTQMEQAIPITYVPARNTIFLSYALAWAEVLKADSIFIGVNAIDYSGYPDCRPEFINAFETMANLATKAGVEGSIKIKIVTPLINLTKAEIIKTGLALGVDYSITHSCYDPSAKGLACGFCDSCLLRKKGFEEACVVDPTQYRVKNNRSIK